MSKMIHIDKEFFFVISKSGNESVFFFNTSDESINNIEPIDKNEINNKIVMKFKSDKDGYYIVQGKKNSVIKKGSPPYYIFLFKNKEPYDDSFFIKINFVDGNTSLIKFKKAISNIYYTDASLIDRPGWIGDDSIYGIMSKYQICQNNECYVSEVSKSETSKSEIDTTVKTAVSKTSVSSSTISTSVKSSSITTNT